MIKKSDNLFLYIVVSNDSQQYLHHNHYLKMFTLQT